MPSRKDKGKIRSLSRSRPRTRAQLLADPHSPAISVSAPASRSTSRIKDFPVADDNNTKEEYVSLSMPTSLVNQESADNADNPFLLHENNNMKAFDGSQNFGQKASNIRATLGVGDNTGIPPASPASLTKMSTLSAPLSGTEHDTEIEHGNSNSALQPATTDPLLFIFAELRAMRSDMKKMSKLDTIESTTEGFSKQLQAVVDRTSVLETSVTSNTTKISTLEQEIKVLKDIVKKQGEIISSVQAVKEDFTQTSKVVIDSMNDLVETQKGQVEDFKESAKKLKAEATSVADKKVGELSKAFQYKTLKDKAFRNRHNLIILGLKEHPSNSAYAVVKGFFRNVLKLYRLNIATAYRLGTAPPEGSNYNRPILVTFPFLADRNAVWRKKNGNITPDDHDKIKIQADLPKQLREDLQLLHRVARAASKLPQYQSATVRDYALQLNGEQFLAEDLESLPQPIRPSSLAIAKSDNSLAFFSKHCELSNHHPSRFTINGNTFQNVEHYLAFKRAEMSDDPSMVEKALQTLDPVGAKSILNFLRNNHEQEWDTQRENIAMEALRAKFNQNKRLQSFLLRTGQLQLGEASKNKVWGVGLNLEDQDILDTSKWLQSGNLLGKMLMKVRRELQALNTGDKN